MRAEFDKKHSCTTVVLTAATEWKSSTPGADSMSKMCRHGIVLKTEQERVNLE